MSDNNNISSSTANYEYANFKSFALADQKKILLLVIKMCWNINISNGEFSN